MKKLVFMFVAMAAVSFASCGGSEAEKTHEDSLKEGLVAADSLSQQDIEFLVANADSLSEQVKEAYAAVLAPVEEEATEAPVEEATEAPAEEATEAPAENA